MKKIVIIIFLISLNVQAQKATTEFKPHYPFNFKDTLLVVKNKSFTKNETSEKIISFTLKDSNWDCKEISFVYYLPKKSLETKTYGNTIYKERNMGKRTFTKKELKKYTSITFKELKEYSKNNKGCNNLQSFLNRPTIYFIVKEKEKLIGYETLPLVWGVTDD